MVSLIVALTAWISMFLTIWLMIFRIVPRNDLFTWGFFILFFLLAGFAGGARDAKK